MSRFIDRTLNSTIGYINQAIYSEKYAKKRGLLQSIDGRMKLIVILLLTISAVYARTIDALILFLLLSMILAVASKIPLSFYIPRVWLFVLIYTGIIAIPAMLNVVTPGTEIVHLITLNGWHLSITKEGLHAAVILVLRVAATSSFVVLMTLTTRWNDIMDAMYSLRMPKIFVLIASMSYRYIFSLMDVTKKMLLSRKSRVMGKEKSVGSWKLYSPIITALFMKSFSFNEKIYLAMLARGFGGDRENRKGRGVDAKSTAFMLVCITSAVILLIYERAYPPMVFRWLLQ
ncbi:MAG: cobalt ECF transporter T component CbiQ [Nitrospiraceae bacterium]|nr:cobalt ECF transporter T component CbiQ [Nitrospiraceae bacterium]